MRYNTIKFVLIFNAKLSLIPVLYLGIIFWCLSALAYYRTEGVCVYFVPCRYIASNDFSYLYLRFNLFLKFITICGWQTLYESLGFNNILKCHLVAKMSSQNFNQQGSCEMEGLWVKSLDQITQARVSRATVLVA